MKTPFIIEIEGTDGSGKQTQCELLYNYLTKNGFNCLKLSFPVYKSTSGELVKQYLTGELGKISPVTPYQASVLYAVNRFATLKPIDVSNYDIIILDRYVGSNMIHQAANVKKEELNQFLIWLEDLEYVKLGLFKPDLTLFLDVPPQISFGLAHARTTLKNNSDVDILEQDKNHFVNAYNLAKIVANKYNWATIKCTKNDKLLPIDEISKQIIDVVKKNLI